MKFVLTRDQLSALLPLVAKKDIRPYLNCLCVRQGPQGTFVCASNGHLAGMLRTMEGEFPIGEVLIHGDDARRLVKSTRAGDVIEFEHVPPMLKATYGDSSTTFRADYGPFPELSRVFPTTSQLKTETPEPAQYDPTYLSAFQDVARTLGSKRGAIAIRQRGNSPALVTLPASPEFVGVLMPWREDVPDEVPEWVAAAGAKVEQPEPMPEAA